MSADEVYRPPGESGRHSLLKQLTRELAAQRAATFDASQLEVEAHGGRLSLANRTDQTTGALVTQWIPSDPAQA